jgi:hypothetical protein
VANYSELIARARRSASGKCDCLMPAKTSSRDEVSKRRHTQLDALGVAADELAGELSEAVLVALEPVPEVATGAGAAVATSVGAGGCTPIEIGASS